jgi:hypothetical protein
MAMGNGQWVRGTKMGRRTEVIDTAELDDNSKAILRATVETTAQDYIQFILPLAHKIQVATLKAVADGADGPGGIEKYAKDNRSVFNAGIRMAAEAMEAVGIARPNVRVNGNIVEQLITAPKGDQQDVMALFATLYRRVGEVTDRAQLPGD